MLNTITDYTLNIILKPIQIDRKIVRLRKALNRLMRNPIRFEHVKLSTNVASRIETYANKTVVLVFTDIDDNYLKPYSKTMHY